VHQGTHRWSLEQAQLWKSEPHVRVVHGAAHAGTPKSRTMEMLEAVNSCHPVQPWHGVNNDMP
jgi:hypothetical protein